MRVFMLGWEFPPFITGGLGTACYGLTKALVRHGAQVVFVLPKAVGTEYPTHAGHVRLLAPQAAAAARGDRSPASVASSYAVIPEQVASTYELVPPQQREAFHGVVFKAVPSRLVSPYARGLRAGVRPGVPAGDEAETPVAAPIGFLQAPVGDPLSSAQQLYAGDMIQETQRYARLCLDLAVGVQFDVIHAHDWMTFPAGMALAAATGRPLVVHVHSTEFDRSGEHVNQAIYDIERRGMHGAIRVVAVSHLTKSIIVHRYAVTAAKVEVVYNGIENGQPPLPTLARAAIRRGDKIVLFLGRITWQKGPEYFVRAAKKVLEKFDQVKFVMAGTGDLAGRVIELAAAEGIGQKFLFTGFLHGPDVERIFKVADVYVMPSVSEPFGIAPLEAIAHDVPVIISKTSGVAEVLTHALKVDFWDVDEIANKILAVLRHPPLSSTLRQHADIELRHLTWDDAADRCLTVYRSALAVMPPAR